MNSQNYISQIEELLKHQKLTQRQLARELGVTFAALSRWIHGHARPHPAKIILIDRLYRQTIGYAGLENKESLRNLFREIQICKIQNLRQITIKNRKLQDELLLEQTYNSNAIEGSTFTKKQTDVVIFGKGMIRDKSLVEHLEVSNHAALLRAILEGEYHGEISQGTIREFHKRLMQGIREDAGQYSKLQRAIRGVDIHLTHPSDIEEEMNELIREWHKIKRSLTVFEKIARFHVHFESIHPFGDGNGRVGRLLMTLQCLDAGFIPPIIENEKKAEYYEVLEYAQRKSDIPFIYFLAKEMKYAHGLFKKYL